MVSILVSPSLLRPLIAALGEEKWHIDLSVFMKEVGFSSVWYFKGVCLESRLIVGPLPPTIEPLLKYITVVPAVFIEKDSHYQSS